MSTIYHAGELLVQKLAGEEAIAELNAKGIKNKIPKGAAAALSTQTLVIAASTDKKGRVWCSLLMGEPGFMGVADEETLTIRSNPVMGDPLIENLTMNPDLGLLVIDLTKKLRMRINGTGRFDEQHRLVVKVEQVYGNCPKYIQQRSLLPNSSFQRLQKTSLHSLVLSSEQAAWIRNSDTFFIGSSSEEGKADASHRGGPPGFVKVESERTLIFPDYFGNSMFNTLGNISSNPNTGLLFIDFDHGHSLQLSGRSEIVWDEKEISLYPAAERIVRFEINEVLFTENGTNLSWK